MSVTEEEELLFLIKAAKDQQSAVEKAMLGLERQRGELHNTIAALKTLQGNLAEEARNGVKDATARATVAMQANIKAALASDVDTARRTLREMAGELSSAAAWLSWRWWIWIFIAGIIAGAVGYSALWHNTDKRLDGIEQTLQQMQVSRPPAPASQAKSHKRSQGGAVPSEALPQEQP